MRVTLFYLIIFISPSHISTIFIRFSFVLSLLIGFALCIYALLICTFLIPCFIRYFLHHLLLFYSILITNFRPIITTKLCTHTRIGILLYLVCYLTIITCSLRSIKSRYNFVSSLTIQFPNILIFLSPVIHL